MGGLILNCDLGENESIEETEQLMAQVDAASICCGVHAGSREKARAVLELAKRCGVMVGAHPGLPVAGGRGSERPSARELEILLEEQLGTFWKIAELLQIEPVYVKLHGTLYHAVEEDEALGVVLFNAIRRLDPNAGVGVFSRAGGRFARHARGEGIRVWEEAFADRGYTEDGQLVPRGQPGAILEDASRAVERTRLWLETGRMPSLAGTSFPLRADTLCVHSDSPNALQLLTQLRSIAGVEMPRS